LYTNDLSDNVQGVAIYVSDELSCNQLYVESFYKDFVILQLSCGTKEKLLIGYFYRSPNSSSVSDEELYSLIKSVYNKFSCKKILVGDFNFSHIDWVSLPCTGGSCNTCNKFLDILQKNFLIQHVQTAMRVRGTDTPHVLDLVITDTYDIIDEIEIRSPLGESDHAIHNIKCQSILHMEDNSTTKFNYCKGDYEKFRNSLDIDWVQVFNSFGSDVDKMWDYF